MKSGIYKIINIKTNEMYVGSSQKMIDRWYKHRYDLRLKKHHNIHLQNAWNKYGEESFKFEIIETCEAIKETLLEREQFYIDSLKPEYNLLPTAGSRLGSKASEETKEKQRKSMIGKNVGKTHTLELRESMKITHKHTETSRKRMSEARIGKSHSEETKKKMSEAHLGYVPKAESVAKTQENKNKNRLEKIKLLDKPIITDKFFTEKNLKRRKLSEDDIRNIRNSNLNDKQLSEIYPVTSTAIRKIRFYKMYKNIV